MPKAPNLVRTISKSTDSANNRTFDIAVVNLQNQGRQFIARVLGALTLVATLLAAPYGFGQVTQVEAENFTANNGVQTENTTDTGGGLNLCHTNDGDWAEYSINIPQAGSYEVDFRVASAGEGGSIEIVSGGTTLGSVDVAVTGGWQTYTNVSTIVTFANAGPQTVRLNFYGDPGYLYNINWFSYRTAPLFLEAENYTSQSGVRTETTTDTGGGLNLSFISNGDWSEYSITIPEAGDYFIDFRTASNNGDGGAIDILADGVAIGNVTVPGTGGWQNWTTVTAYVNFATAGTKTLRLNYTGGAGSLFNVNWLSIAPYVPEAPLTLTVGNTPKQQMRYGIDYERLWFWQGSSAVRDRFAEWSVADCDVDYVRVAINSKYELTEGVLQEDAYFDNDDNEGGGTNNDRIIPMMQDMVAANPDIKFFASPRPLNEAISGVAWQPYPQWITGSTGNSSNFSFDEVKCSEYLLRYLILMKQYGFKISYMDLTNEWNFVNGTDFRDISALFDAYVAAPANAKPVVHPDYPTVTLTADDIPELIGPSAWSYTQGSSWLNGLFTGLRRDAVDIASCHNTDKGGTAQDFVDKLEDIYDGEEVPEAWNTELHGWKSTSNADEVLTYAYMMECINAGFSGISGWLAVGFSNQGHCYIVNSQRSVKYYMFEKLTNTSNRGYALDVNEPEELKVYWDPDPDQADADSAVSALIRGNLMTVWVLNHSDTDYPVIINPTGRTISDHPIKVTRWSQHDGISIEGEVQTIEASTNTSVEAIAQDNSAYCFEILLEPESGVYTRIQAEGYDNSNPSSYGTEATTDVGAGLNLTNTNNGNWTSYHSIDLSDATNIRFRIAAPSGRPDGEIEIRTGSATGPVIGRTAIPVTGDWQEWLTIETPLEATSGTHDLYLTYTEAGSNQTSSASMFNLNWFELVLPNAPPTEAPSNLTATANGATQIDLAWNAVTGATSYKVLRSTSASGTYSEITSGLTATNTSDNTALPGTTYYYVVRAVNAEGESPDSSSANATLPLEAPAGVGASPVGTLHINLSWNASLGATSYEILRATSSTGANAETLGTVTTTSSNDTTALPGITYFYAIKALTSASESGYSSIVSATLPLGTPTGLTATNANSSQIDLSWNIVSGATEYSIKRALTSGGTYNTIATGVTSLTYSDTTGLTPGTRYYYVVTATTSGSESDPSDEGSAVPSDPIVPENVVMASLDLGYDLQGGEQLSASVSQSGLGQFYQIMASPDLSDNMVWTPKSAVFLGNGGLLEIDFNFDYSAHDKYFFRLEAWTEE